MLSAEDMLWGGFLPACVAAATWSLVWARTRNAASSWRTALVVGYVAGHWGLDTSFQEAILKTFRPREARDWFPLAMLLAMIPDAIACVGRWGPAGGWLLRLSLCAVLPWRLLAGSSYLPNVELDVDFDTGAWSTGEAFAWLLSSSLLLLAVWSWIRAVDVTLAPIGRATLVIVVTLAAAVTLALSGSLVLAQLMGVVTAADGHPGSGVNGRGSDG